MTTLKTIGVIGAGVMGAGLAQNLAQTGHNVLLIDNCRKALDRAKSRIRDGARMQRLLQQPGTPAIGVETLMERITFAEQLDCLSAADYVIENVTEKWEVKLPLYKQIDTICRPDIVFAANTSCIPITRIGGATRRPTNVIGTHYMNPVPMKDTVEVIRGYHTSEATIETTKKLLSQLGKQYVVVNDAPGFVSNRVLMLTINEAAYVVSEGTATPEEVDRIFKSCFGHKMGPLETGDLIGLDTILLSLEVLFDSFKDSKYRPCPLLQKMVDAGLTGRKSGKGFYEYDMFQATGSKNER